MIFIALRCNMLLLVPTRYFQAGRSEILQWQLPICITKGDKMPDLWTQHLTLRGEFLYWLDKLEALLCGKLRGPGALHFPAQLMISLKRITKSDRKQWSGPSLIWDLVCDFHEMDYNAVAKYAERPDDVLWPTVPRAYLEYLQTMSSHVEPKGDEHEFALAFAEQFYDMLRCLAGMGPKTIPKLFETRGIKLESVSRSSVASLELERQSPRREYISLLPSKFFHHDQDRSLFAICHPELPLFREQPEHECYPDGGVALKSTNRPTMTMAGLQDHVVTLEGVIKGTDKKLEDIRQELKELRGQKEDLQSKNTQLAKKSSELQDRLQKLGRQRTI